MGQNGPQKGEKGLTNDHLWGGEGLVKSSAGHENGIRTGHCVIVYYCPQNKYRAQNIFQGINFQNSHHRKLTTKIPARNNSVILALGSVFWQRSVLDGTRSKMTAKTGTGINSVILDREITAKKANLETFIAGALYRGFREVMRILTIFLENPQKSIIIRVFQLAQTAETPVLWWISEVVRIRMTSRNSLYNAPTKKSPN